MPCPNRYCEDGCGICSNDREDEWQPSPPEAILPTDPIANGPRWLQALREIRDQDWVENCLDPQWAARIASEALRDA